MIIVFFIEVNFSNRMEKQFFFRCISQIFQRFFESLKQRFQNIIDLILFIFSNTDRMSQNSPFPSQAMVSAQLNIQLDDDQQLSLQVEDVYQNGEEAFFERSGSTKPDSSTQAIQQVPKQVLELQKRIDDFQNHQIETQEKNKKDMQSAKEKMLGILEQNKIKITKKIEEFGKQQQAWREGTMKQIKRAFQKKEERQENIQQKMKDGEKNVESLRDIQDEMRKDLKKQKEELKQTFKRMLEEKRKKSQQIREKMYESLVEDVINKKLAEKKKQMQNEIEQKMGEVQVNVNKQIKDKLKGPLDKISNEIEVLSNKVNDAKEKTDSLLQSGKIQQMIKKEQE